MSRMRWVATAITWFGTSVAVAQDSPVPLSADGLLGELDRLIAIYEGLDSASVRKTNLLEPDVVGGSVVLATGEFVAKFWRVRPEDELALFNVSHWDGHLLRSTHGPPRFIEGKPPSGYTDPPGPVQYWDAPWPFLHDWCVALAADPATRGARDQSMLRFESDSLGLALTFGEGNECREVEVTREDLRTRISFSGYTPTGDGRWLVPTEQERVFFLGAAEPEKARVDRWSLTEVRFNEPGAQEALAWDPDTLGVYRYAPSTGNVYSGDGTLLYNEQEWAERALGMSKTAGLARRLLVPGLVVLAAVSGVLAYRRLRR